MSLLAEACGIWGKPPRDEADLVELAEQARLFLRAGGRLTLTEWLQLDHEERAALTAAGELERERA